MHLGFILDTDNTVGLGKLGALKNDIHGHNLRKVILCTEQHLGEKISLQNAANLVGYEKHYFCNKFKNLTGISYMNYVNNLRIQYACELLTKGETASSVCEQCGFDNLSYFIQLFKKITGTTPKAFSAETYYRKVVYRFLIDQDRISIISIISCPRVAFCYSRHNYQTSLIFLFMNLLYILLN